MKVIAEMWTWSTADSKRKVGERTSDHIRGELSRRSVEGWRLVGAYFKQWGSGFEGDHYLYFEKIVEP